MAQQFKFQAIASYEAAGEGQLTLDKDAVVTVITTDADGVWADCVLEADESQRGWVPMNHLQPIIGEAAKSSKRDVKAKAKADRAREKAEAKAAAKAEKEAQRVEREAAKQRKKADGKKTGSKLHLDTETASVLEDKSTTQNTLEGFLKSRPTPRDLVEKNILQETNSDDAKQQRRTKLAGFLSKRHAKPTRKGKLEDSAPQPIMGVKIEEVAAHDNAKIPFVVTGTIYCIRKQEYTRLEGVFRLSGGAADIKKVIEIFENDPDSAAEILPTLDPHAVTGVLKKFFRELPEPLIPFRMYSMFNDATRTDNTAAQLQTFKALLKMLPAVNAACLSLLIPFLKEVSLYSSTNRMDPSNLGIVFGPTLMRSEDPMQGMLNDRSAAAIQLLIEHSDELFDPLPPVSATAPSRALDAPAVERPPPPASLMPGAPASGATIIAGPGAAAALRLLKRGPEAAPASALPAPLSTSAGLSRSGGDSTSAAALPPPPPLAGAASPVSLPPPPASLSTPGVSSSSSSPSTLPPSLTTPALKPAPSSPALADTSALPPPAPPPSLATAPLPLPKPGALHAAPRVASLPGGGASPLPPGLVKHAPPPMGLERSMSVPTTVVRSLSPNRGGAARPGLDSSGSPLAFSTPPPGVGGAAMRGRGRGGRGGAVRGLAGLRGRGGGAIGAPAGGAPNPLAMSSPAGGTDATGSPGEMPVMRTRGARGAARHAAQAQRRSVDASSPGRSGMLSRASERSQSPGSTPVERRGSRPVSAIGMHPSPAVSSGSPSPELRSQSPAARRPRPLSTHFGAIQAQLAADLQKSDMNRRISMSLGSPPQLDLGESTPALNVDVAASSPSLDPKKAKKEKKKEKKESKKKK
mmetsp:Transcript_1110/g.3421  ORF Transcript_1110/g.3421 Transcript_1110/m.3421 type:complete len:863 (+) Transcript_1110:272-2860(+)|eukprot:CAMPEP_0177632854 /NCGR_PEP_ID=MMETSP0447-20121125/2526_1 /TAXON_ID=0 /ORGANISM="Stygamoeba regulata, Strain BSH-02190019" /LENGTH=862 /DNA_ID=CAMNT_0019134475 /DNA_START=186 /DNA_END=2774 /DNA_ORIENTATION=-